MRVFKYDEPAYAGNGSFMGGNTIVVTEQQIIDTYFPFWKRKMIQKYGEDSTLINTDNCIEDWCITHWAWEEKDSNEK